MYHAHFGLSESPFALTPDPRYLFLTASHREALASMIYAVRERRGFVVILGEVGTGKTTVIRRVLGTLGPDVRTVYLFHPNVTFVELLRQALAELGLPAGGGRVDMLEALNGYLLAERAAGRWVVFIVDEAQHLSAEVLEELRLLSNLETASSKLLQIILVGQPELAETLGQPGLRQLRQRIGLATLLSPLSPGETVRYVAHRLRVAGGSGALPFTRGALRLIRRRSHGIPRLVNVICDHAMVLAYGAGVRRVRRGVVRRVLRERRALPETAILAPRDRRWRRLAGPIAATAMAAGALAALWPSAAGLWPRPSALDLPALVGMASLLPLATQEPAAMPQPPPTQEPLAAHESPAAAPSLPEREPGRPEPAAAWPSGDVLAERGDTLEALVAQVYGRVDLTLLDLVKRANPGLADIDRIGAGTQLRFPAPTSEAFVVRHGRHYLVHLATLPAGDADALQRLRDAIRAHGGVPYIVAARLGRHRSATRVLAGDFTTSERAREFREAVDTAQLTSRENP
jgi:general secretion pathway protein A